MAVYKYKVYKAGKSLSGEIEGKDKKDVAKILVNEGCDVIWIKQKTFFNSPDLLDFNIGGIPAKEKTVFLRQLAYMIQAGLPINQALETLTSQIKNKQFKKILSEVAKEVQQGTSLSLALSKHDKTFDIVIINLVKAGEESGNLDKILDRLAFDFEKRNEFSGKVKGALIYPAVLLVVIAGVVAMLMIVMVPSIKNLYKDFGGKNKELPLITQITVVISDFMVGYWWLIIVVIIAMYFAFKYYQKTPGGRITINMLQLKVPVFGKLIKLSNIAEFARSLSMLLNSGVPIVKSLSLVGGSLRNKLFANEVMSASKKIEKGVILSQSFSRDNNVFTPMVFQMLSIGEQTGKTDSTLLKLAEYYEREVDQMTANLTKILEPIILVVMALIVLFIALAVYLPVYTLGT